ncbi:hypothetical protein [Shimia sagamensis]|uniref:DUF1127 domain-containing protein n=1 Tax=Shimia sagamensis TaxID=1566352 RepID=A0ABY1PL71_9RHOB|nr:hypothetical protein [Shimia sagamensis]SMP36505.1 hypothetical protein SAMN06265373_1171 [Shimia sagamensis]
MSIFPMWLRTLFGRNEYPSKDRAFLKQGRLYNEHIDHLPERLLRDVGMTPDAYSPEKKRALNDANWVRIGMINM